jgi:hypothetical protein
MKGAEMKCKIIVKNNSWEIEEEINSFIKNKENCQVSISSTRYSVGW